MEIDAEFWVVVAFVIVIGIVRAICLGAAARSRHRGDRLIGDGHHVGGRIDAEHFGIDRVVRLSRHSSLSFRLLGTTGPADNSG